MWHHVAKTLQQTAGFSNTLGRSMNLTAATHSILPGNVSARAFCTPCGASETAINVQFEDGSSRDACSHASADSDPDSWTDKESVTHGGTHGYGDKSVAHSHMDGNSKMSPAPDDDAVSDSSGGSCKDKALEKCELGEDLEDIGAGDASAGVEVSACDSQSIQEPSFGRGRGGTDMEDGRGGSRSGEEVAADACILSDGFGGKAPLATTATVATKRDKALRDRVVPRSRCAGSATSSDAAVKPGKNVVQAQPQAGTAASGSTSAPDGHEGKGLNSTLVGGMDSSQSRALGSSSDGESTGSGSDLASACSARSTGFIAADARAAHGRHKQRQSHSQQQSKSVEWLEDPLDTAGSNGCRVSGHTDIWHVTSPGKPTEHGEFPANSTNTTILRNLSPRGWASGTVPRNRISVAACASLARALNRLPGSFSSPELRLLHLMAPCTDDSRCSLSKMAPTT
jgi:hypothetical protein